MALRNFLIFALFFVSLSLTQARDIAPSPAYNTIYPKEPVDRSVDYLFQFGDSISDTGNLVIENPVQGHNFAVLPYGVTMNKPTGRCSDGLLMIDQFTSFFHKPYLHPYLDKFANFSNGVNFAVAGSTALSTSTLMSMGVISPVTTSSLNVQLDWFRAHLEKICDTALDCQKKLSRSLVLIETGGNDYNYAMLEAKTMDQVRDMVPQVVDTIINAAKQIISYGATRVYIPGNFPIGCLPIYKATFNKVYSSDDLGCLEGLNAFARFHNDYLKNAIIELQREYPEVAVVYGDYYSALSSVLHNAGPLGFDVPNMFKACCGSGDNEYNFDMTRLCGSQGYEVCAEPNTYVSWDGIHMTQHTYKQMSQFLLEELKEQLNNANRKMTPDLDDLGCLEEPNALATFHNDYLKKAIKELQQDYPEATLVYGDYYSAMSSVLKNGEALGFDAASKFKACCGVADNEYNFDTSRMCGSLETHACSEPNRFISWDGIHTTQEANSRMSQLLLRRLVRDLNIQV